MRDKIYFVIIISAFLLYIVNIFYHSKNEMTSSYDFIITKINVYKTARVSLSSKSIQFSFWNFNIYESNNIKINDRLYKPKCSEKIFIYRKTNNEKEQLVETINLSNSWFHYKCK